jgi:hypothetical protein
MDQKLKSAHVDWISSFDFDIIATFTFTIGQRPSQEIAAKMLRNYFKHLDRYVYGRGCSADMGLRRVVFPHTGQNRDNAHFHVLIKSPIDKDDFCVLLNALWRTKVERAASCDQNEITPINNVIASSAYGLHEFFRYDDQTIDLELSILTPSASTVSIRPDAHARLLEACDPKILEEARAAYPIHVQKVTDRMSRKRAKHRRTA